jgi:hypothetical protein
MLHLHAHSLFFNIFSGYGTENQIAPKLLRSQYLQKGLLLFYRLTYPAYRTYMSEYKGLAAGTYDSLLQLQTLLDDEIFKDVEVTFG